MGWKHYLGGLCGFALGFWLCMPRNIVLMPRYEVLVEDTSGKGLASVHVEQFRQDQAITGSKSFSITTADSYGRAAFPSVSGRISPLRQRVACARQKAVHATCGYQHSFVVDAPGYGEAGRFESDLPLKSRGRLLQVTMQPFPRPSGL